MATVGQPSSDTSTYEVNECSLQRSKYSWRDFNFNQYSHTWNEPHHQCDQIWRNFATLANLSKHLAIYTGFYLALCKICKQYSIFLCYWVHFHCYKRPSYRQIIEPSLVILRTTIKWKKNQVSKGCVIGDVKVPKHQKNYRRETVLILRAARWRATRGSPPASPWSASRLRPCVGLFGLQLLSPEIWNGTWMCPLSDGKTKWPFWETTNVQEVVGSNPGTVYWMDMAFFTMICCENCIVCLKRPKINDKEPRVAHFFKKMTCNIEIT